MQHLEGLNNDPRSMNGPEEAHDYLWLTQDLWMNPDVWRWANENQDVRKVVLKGCGREGCSSMEETVTQFKRCSACQLVCFSAEIRDLVYMSFSRLCTAALLVRNKTGWCINQVRMNYFLNFPLSFLDLLRKNVACNAHKQRKAVLRSFQHGKPVKDSSIPVFSSDFPGVKR